MSPATAPASIRSRRDVAIRYLLVCQAVGRPDLEHIWPHLAQVFADYGLPKAMRSDNGPPFAGFAVP